MVVFSIVQIVLVVIALSDCNNEGSILHTMCDVNEAVFFAHTTVIICVAVSFSKGLLNAQAFYACGGTDRVLLYLRCFCLLEKYNANLVLGLHLRFFPSLASDQARERSR